MGGQHCYCFRGCRKQYLQEAEYNSNLPHTQRDQREFKKESLPHVNYSFKNDLYKNYMVTHFNLFIQQSQKLFFKPSQERQSLHQGHRDKPPCPLLKDRRVIGLNKAALFEAQKKTKTLLKGRFSNMYQLKVINMVSLLSC